VRVVEDAVDRIVEQWARERPELDVSPIGVIGRISRLAVRYDDAIRDGLRDFGLQPDEYDVLATLRRSGEPYELCPRDLLGTMMVSSGTMTHRLDKLEQRGLVRRRPDPDDRRSVLVSLSPEGRELIDRAAEAHVANELSLVADLTSEDRAALVDLLRRLGRALDAR
jgi:DNA-binding MarR family transcriptional regulator